MAYLAGKLVPRLCVFSDYGVGARAEITGQRYARGKDSKRSAGGRRNVRRMVFDGFVARGQRKIYRLWALLFFADDPARGVETALFAPVSGVENQGGRNSFIDLPYSAAAVR